jgi:hypothetical protein
MRPSVNSLGSSHYSRFSSDLADAQHHAAVLAGRVKFKKGRYNSLKLDRKVLRYGVEVVGHALMCELSRLVTLF